MLAGAVEVRKELADLTELDLPATLLFDYPSPDELAAYILETLPQPVSRPAPTRKPNPIPSPTFGQPTLGQPTLGQPTRAQVSAESAAAEPERPVWWYMPQGERIGWAAEVVRQAVVTVLDKDLDTAQPLMMAGLDSLGEPIADC